jgi:heptaprenylglyceryl phosphate synthase
MRPCHVERIGVARFALEKGALVLANATAARVVWYGGGIQASSQASKWMRSW